MNLPAIDLLRLNAAWPDRYPFLLQSVAHGSAQGRFDILPVPLRNKPDIVGDEEQRFLDLLSQKTSPYRQQSDNRSTGVLQRGWFVYLGYELVQEIEPRVNNPRFQSHVPYAAAWRTPVTAILDHAKQEITVPEAPGHEALRIRLIEDLASAPALPPKAEDAIVVTAEAPDRYRDHVRRIKRYIRAGDVFQVNISRLWRADTNLASWALFDRLRKHNPGPFAALAIMPFGSVISSSPERLVCVHGRNAQTRPIAGTHPRGDNRADDLALQKALLDHPKERAEHVMIVDLERNDLGRVCVPGSVQVSERMVLETYQHVHHIVSNIEGQLRHGIDPADVIRAVFPGGTITGCPKVRCMQIIAELEQVGRGPYTGAVGWIDDSGDMDLNILIRTIWQKDGSLWFRAGGGIVYDSDPERELRESAAKAQGLISALQGG